MRNLEKSDELTRIYRGQEQEKQKSVPLGVSKKISDELEYREVFGSGPVWTCTPSKAIPISDIPLTVSGHPVVVPVQYHYPASAFTVPPPDPHPHLIDSSVEIDEDTVNDIFQVYEGAVGFYLLINGMLQLIVTEDFDFEYALSHLPNEFGGLRVSYIPQIMEPTAHRRHRSSLSSVEEESIPGQPESRQWDTASPAVEPQPPIHSQMTNTSSPGIDRTPVQDNTINLKIGSMVHADVKRNKTVERFQGKIGLMTEENGRYYLVVSSHIFTKALIAAKSDQFPGENWKNHVAVIASSGGREV